MMAITSSFWFLKILHIFIMQQERHLPLAQPDPVGAAQLPDEPPAREPLIHLFAFNWL